MRNFIVIICFLCVILVVSGQQRTTKMEFHNYKIVNNKIVIKLIMNGVEGDFVLDLVAKNSITPQFLSKIGDVVLSETTVFDFSEYRNVQSSKKAELGAVAFGDIVYSNAAKVLVLEGESAKNLETLGVDGVINGSLFKNSVLTIDKKNKRIIISDPYRPPFIRLNERIDLQFTSSSDVPHFSIFIGDREKKVIFDTWQEEVLILDNIDNVAKARKESDISLEVGTDNYGKNMKVSSVFTFPTMSLVNINIENVKAPILESTKKSLVGLGILDYGLISIDFGKGKIYFQDYESTEIKESNKGQLTQLIPGKLNDITKDDFIEYIYDYKSISDFKLKGDKPVIIDFWAPWCGPCMRMMPTMEKLAAEYKDQIIFYKVNADLEKELAARFKVVALPTMFFINPGEGPSIHIGDQSAKIKDLIDKLKINKK